MVLPICEPGSQVFVTPSTQSDLYGAKSSDKSRSPVCEVYHSTVGKQANKNTNKDSNTADGSD